MIVTWIKYTLIKLLPVVLLELPKEDNISIRIKILIGAILIDFLAILVEELEV